jgi:hypothetical protein
MDGKTNQENEKEVLMMTGNIPIPEENVKFIVNDLTPERILRYIDVEDRLRGIDVKDILRGIDVEDIIQNLRDEDIQKLKRILNQKDNGRKNKSRK